MSGELVWQDPPDTKGHTIGPVWEGRLAPLKEHPGKWALLGRHAAVMSTRIKQGQVAGVTAGEFEAIGRHLKDGKVDLYVRFVGGS